MRQALLLMARFFDELQVPYCLVGDVMRLAIQGVAIELLVARRQYELEALARARREEFQGISLAVAAPEDLIILKLSAGGPQDLYDVAGILQVQAGRLEEDYL
ncbi:MAG: hypothetical protein QJR13_09655, partial [Bacillota bacterium]|nr:hypothetical protein [Bacillota bacterium]